MFLISGMLTYFCVIKMVMFYHFWVDLVMYYIGDDFFNVKIQGKSYLLLSEQISITFFVFFYFFFNLTS